MVYRESKLIYQWVAKCYGSSIWFLNLFRSNSSRSCTLFLFIRKILKNIIKCSRIDPIYSWNRQLAHTPFPKKIKTPTTTVRFIRFVAKISVLSPKLPADGQWAKKTKEWVTFFICSPLIDRTNKEQSFSITYFARPFLIGFFNANRFNLVISFRLSLTSCLTGERLPLLKCSVPKIPKIKGKILSTALNKGREARRRTYPLNWSSSNQLFLGWGIVCPHK